MKVLFDHHTFATQQFGGVSRYFYELVNSLPESGINVDLALKTTPNFYLLGNKELQAKYGYTKFEHREFLPGINFRGKSRIIKKLNRNALSPMDAGLDIARTKIKQGDFDLLHVTYYDPYFLDILNGKPYVVTVYDMIHEMYTENLVASEWKRIALKKKVIENAARLMAISERTKQDVINVLGIDAGKIDVVHLYNSLGSKGFDDTARFPEKYILYVGHRWGYKNFLMFAEVFAQIAKEDKDLHLVCIGGGGFSTEEVELFRIVGIEDRVVHMGGKDETIRSAYSKALAFIYPSIYEGFGIPILEAFDLDCPVICADNGVFREVADEAAEYFQPKDWSGMRSAITNVIYNEEKQKTLVKLGKLRSKNFSLDKLISGTVATYKKVV